jgi:N-methylhydantoinase B/oxoprolinase/acetone carboxylase alpha subunit
VAVDGARLAIISSRMNVIVEAMMNTIFRSSRSGVLNSAHDFSCCIISADHQLVMGAESLPIHMLSGPDLISKAIAEHFPEFRRGDAFLHNSPYKGNSHAADHTLFVPVVDDSGRHRFSVLAKAHQADCGNSQPTTYMAIARDVYEEGALIFDACRVATDYKDHEDVLRLLRSRIRVPEQWWGDYLALMGAVRLGEARMLELGEEIGWDALEEYARQWLDYSEARAIEAISKLPAREVRVSTMHDEFPGAPGGYPISISICVRPTDGRIDVDLTENGDCMPNGLNLTEATSRTAAMIGIFNSLGGDVPPNSGSLRRVHVRLRENCAVGIPRFPHSCSAATTNLADRVANAVQRGIAELGEGIGMAECGAVIPAAAAVVSGEDPRRDGRPFVNQIFLAVTGGAGTPWSDAWLTMFHVGGAGMLRRDSVEIAELAHPLRVLHQRLVPDSEGAGQYRGAPSADVEFGPVGTSMWINYGTDGASNPALGARGGQAGGPTRHFRRGVDGNLTELLPYGLIELQDGETVVSITAAGGGYGEPGCRDPEAVAKDVRDGLVTRGRAEAVYRVVLTPDLAVDGDATRRLRQAAQGPSGASRAEARSTTPERDSSSWPEPLTV